MACEGVCELGVEPPPPPPPGESDLLESSSESSRLLSLLEAHRPTPPASFCQQTAPHSAGGCISASEANVGDLVSQLNQLISQGTVRIETGQVIINCDSTKSVPVPPSAANPASYLGTSVPPRNHTAGMTGLVDERLACGVPDIAVKVVIPTVEELCSETRTNIKCPKEGCTKVCANTPALHMHYSKTHGQSPEFPDSDSQSSCLEEDLLSEWTSPVKAHREEKVFYCPVSSCSRSVDFGRFFTRRSFVKNHYQRSHMEKKFICRNCKSKFSLSSELHRHEACCGRVYLCFCGVSYSTRQALVTHAKRHKHTFPEVPIFRHNSPGLKRKIEEEGGNVKVNIWTLNSGRSPDHPGSRDGASLVIQRPGRANGSFSDDLVQLLRSQSRTWNTEKNFLVQQKIEACQVNESVIVQDFGSRIHDDLVDGEHGLTTQTVILEGVAHESELISSDQSPSSIGASHQVTMAQTAGSVSDEDTVYYTNSMETQTDISRLGHREVQQTQTDTSTCAIYGGGGGAQRATAIQTDISQIMLHDPSQLGADIRISPVKYYKSAHKLSSGAQTQVIRKSKSISTQTDSPKKRRRVKMSKTCEIECQTTPDSTIPAAIQSVDMQTAPEFNWPTDPSYTQSHTVMHNMEPAPIHSIQCQMSTCDWMNWEEIATNHQLPRSQSETQTLPFDMSLFDCRAVPMQTWDNRDESNISTQTTFSPLLANQNGASSIGCQASELAIPGQTHPNGLPDEFCNIEDFFRFSDSSVF